MRIWDFLTNSTRHYFGTVQKAVSTSPTPPTNPIPYAPTLREKPVTQDADFLRVSQGRFTSQEDLHRYEPNEAPLIAEKYSFNEMRDFLALYSNHVWTYRCAGVIATSCASVKFVWKKGDKTLKDADLMQL